MKLILRRINNLLPHFFSGPCDSVDSSEPTESDKPEQIAEKAQEEDAQKNPTDPAEACEPKSGME